MTALHEWAQRHNISPQAMQELAQLFGTHPTDPAPLEGESEVAVQTRIRLEASYKGQRLWRNNVGMLMSDEGFPVRFGLANDSSQMNKQIKSSDLIGIRPVIITQCMVGSVIGQFVAREVKAGSWKYKATDREVAQLRFLELVISMGGDGAFANDTGSL